MQDVFKHKFAYSLLAILAVIYIVIVALFHAISTVMLSATLVYAVLYFLWGVIHHLYEKNLTFRIVLEYFLVSALGIVVMSTLVL